MNPVHWIMSTLAAVSIIYGLNAVGYYFNGRPGMMLTFVGYVIANVGLIWDAAQHG